MGKLTVDGQRYEVLDLWGKLTLADSLVKNKLGVGHGEAKLYLGNEGPELTEFFGDFRGACFFCKSDFQQFLADAEPEYQAPEQNYLDKASMPQRYEGLLRRLACFSQERLPFLIERVNVQPPRVYIRSESDYYEYMRSVGLPNLSYVSILKLRDEWGQVSYYYKIFMDGPAGVYPEVQEVPSARAAGTGKTTVLARVGQGEYRRRVLEECKFCPFTGVNDERLLIASHIKPWAKATPAERLDPKNGLALTPTYDKLFDQGFLTFTRKKELLVSPWLSPMNQKRLKLYTGKVIADLPLDRAREAYLAYHRQMVFKG